MGRILKIFLIVYFSSNPSFLFCQWDISHTMEVGKKALDHHDYTTSITFFNHIISSRSNYHKAYYLRGIAKMNLGDYIGSESDLTATIRLNPYYYDAYEQRGAVRIRLGEYTKAIEDYKVATLCYPNNPQVWYNLTLCELQSGNYSSSDSLSDVIIEKWPASTEGYLLKSWAKYGIGDLSNSENLIDKVLTQDPYNLAALTIKSNYLFRTERWEEAIAMYSRALHIHPKHVQNLLNRGLCKLKLGLDSEAATDFNLAIELNPNNPLCEKYRTYIDQDEEDKLISHLMEADDFVISKSMFLVKNTDVPTDILTKYDLIPPHNLTDYQNEAYKPDESFKTGYEHLCNHNYISAISALSKSIQQNPQIPESYYNRAFAYAYTNNFEMAIKDLDVAIEERPLFAEAYFNRGILKLLKKEKEAAKYDFSKAGELGINTAYTIIRDIN